MGFCKGYGAGPEENSVSGVFVVVRADEAHSVSGRFKVVGFLIPSHTQKTFKIMYASDDLFELVARLQNYKMPKEYVFLGQIQRWLLHDSIDSSPMVPVEINQFLNAYSPERKSPAEILNAIPLADAKKLEENHNHDVDF